MKKFLTVLAAAAAVVLACAFVACKNDDDGGSSGGGGGSVVSKWGYVTMWYTGRPEPDENDYKINEDQEVFTFYSNGKVEVSFKSQSGANIVYTGKYTGDTTKPGDKITLTVAKDNDERYCEGTVTDGGNLIRFSEYWSTPESKGTQSAYQKYYFGKM
ncbi:MAG: hypothetical protein J1D88_09100 [Treponema sp.]|nr:hypothetical protein [Treponema sp.]